MKATALGWSIAALLCVAALAAPSGDFRLLDAAQKRDNAAIRSLMKEHVDVNAIDGDGATALTWAAHWNDLETAELLIGAGANVNTISDYGVTPLWEACNNGSAALVEKLVSAGANPNVPLLHTGETALMTCAHTGNPDAVKSLIAHGAEVNVKENQKAQTALMWALEERHPEAAQVVIEHGADVHAKSKGGFTPLLFAARQGDIASARLLLERGSDVNEPAPGGQNVLLLATDSGHEDFAIFLLEKGANPNAADGNGLTALHYSLRKAISVLRAAIRDPQFGQLDYLLRPNMPKLVKALLEHGADPNARIKVDLARIRVNDRVQLGLAGATPFLLAAATGDVGIMRDLLAKGADPKLATKDNTTPLMVAAGVGWQQDRSKEEEKQAVEALRMLVEMGADVNAVSKDMGATALHGAAFTGANEVIKFLVEKGAKLDAMDKFGETPLSIAEGDPNGLKSDFGGVITPVHESTAKLIRQLGGELWTQREVASAASQTN